MTQNLNKRFLAAVISQKLLILLIDNFVKIKIPFESQP